MAIVSVELSDTFNEWRVKTNTIATETGDITTLSTTNKSSVVAAINEIFSNDSDDMENLVDDTTPQLGGELDLNNNNITGTGSIDITGSGTFSGNIQGSIQMVDGGSPTSIISVGNANIRINPHGTGIVEMETPTLKLGPSGTDVTVTTNGSGTLKLAPNAGGGTQPLLELENVGHLKLIPPSGKEVKVLGPGIISATTFSGDVNGTINTATTATTQSASDNSTKVATTAYADTAANNALAGAASIGLIIALG